ncbi:MAG: DUF4440 domain-containing protein [Ewingella americana]|uniref:DUF4440 domain-containing protein n=1 Tax=Ewingella americana TaxID=41202 RepID=UPI00242A94FA|nr:DUF4440 domain-containing protein [Ewingella americana]MCI1678145.1 DUF4440 domain-containing protein [Ewingella americana]MCI1856218.1 DUF4440 domain-containing protein [Ewingella americana]MCI1862443.1 DUF4440 domain-containing protein [Ewingella americana]MCI2162395.1 DUF4440 domain-containing protein [Ewingella americana]MCI2209156.1 DUF4440 domain-containing protein [Ewingella americana]
MNRYFQEVLDAHDLIANWLGDANSSQTTCDQLLGRFSPHYSMVTLSGHVLDFEKLCGFFQSQHGAKNGLQIEIADMKLVAESADGAVVSYQERQQLPGQNATLRYSTVVFSVDAEGKVIWRHLHETAAAI